MGLSELLAELQSHVRQWFRTVEGDERRQSQADTTATASTETPSRNAASPNGERLSSAPVRAETRAVDSPEAAIFALLTEQGGGIRQAEIVAQTDWSKSTISRCLSKLEEHGHVKRVPLNNSNLVLLPGRDLADFTKLSYDPR